MLSFLLIQVEKKKHFFYIKKNANKCIFAPHTDMHLTFKISEVATPQKEFEILFIREITYLISYGHVK